MAGTILVDATTPSHPTPAGAGSALQALMHRVLGDQRARFLLAGALNTAFGYACFVVYQHTIGIHWGYMSTLALTHVTSVGFAFITHRSFVFRVSGRLLHDLWRFESVYLAALGLNAVLLPALVELVGVPVLVSQAAITCLSVAMSWLGHSQFSFRRTSTPSP